MKYDVVGIKFKRYLVRLIQCLACRVKLQSFSTLVQNPLPLKLIAVASITSGCSWDVQTV